MNEVACGAPSNPLKVIYWMRFALIPAGGKDPPPEPAFKAIVQDSVKLALTLEVNDGLIAPCVPWITHWLHMNAVPSGIARLKPESLVQTTGVFGPPAPCKQPT